MRVITLVWSLVFLCFSAPGKADYTLRIYKEAKSSGGVAWEGMRFYLDGAGNAYEWANGMLLRKHQPLLFCVPDNLSLSSDNYIDILDRRITADRLPDDAIINFSLLQALISTFPCRK